MSCSATEAVVSCNDSPLGVRVKIEILCARRDAVVYRHVQSEVEITIINQSIPSYFDLMSTHQLSQSYWVE